MSGIYRKRELSHNDTQSTKEDIIEFRVRDADAVRGSKSNSTVYTLCDYKG